jgi:hypothetical protein
MIAIPDELNVGAAEKKKNEASGDCAAASNRVELTVLRSSQPHAICTRSNCFGDSMSKGGTIVAPSHHRAIPGKIQSKI